MSQHPVFIGFDGEEIDEPAKKALRHLQILKGDSAPPPDPGPRCGN